MSRARRSMIAECGMRNAEWAHSKSARPGARERRAGAIRNPQYRLGAASILAGVLGIVLAAAPLVGAHSEDAAVSVKTYTPITIDGTLQDWVRRLERSNWTGQMQVQKGEVVEWIRAVPVYVNAISSRVESGRVDDPDDFSAIVYTLWDAEYFYVAAIVTDDDVVAQHEGADIWQDDALEVWLDCRHDAVTRTLFQDDEYQLGFSPASHERDHAVAWAWRNPRAEAVTGTMRVGSSRYAGGYVIEGSVPWAALEGCDPAVGGMIGFNISLVDKDHDQLWSHVTWSGSLHSNPSQFGHLYFVDAPVDLFPSDVFDVPPESSPMASVWGSLE